MTTGAPGASRRLPWTVGLIGAALTVVAAKGTLPGLGNDATSYVAIADRLARRGELGYFLEPRLALWPPGWPALLAFPRWVADISPLATALVVNAAMCVVIAFEAWWLLRRVTSNPRLVTIGTTVAVLGPATLSQTYMVQTEPTFIAIVLGAFIALISFTDRWRHSGSRRCFWLAMVLMWAAFFDRYVGIVAIGACSLWLVFERGTGAAVVQRWKNGVGFFLGSSAVPAAWLIRNAVVTGDLSSAFGPRDTPLETYQSNLVDAATSIGQFLHGVARYEPFTGLLRLISLAVAGVVGVLAIVLARRALANRRAAPDALSRPPVGLGDLLGHPVGLLVIYGVAHWLYMIYSASTIAFDPVNTRYLAPMFIPMLIAGLALVDRGARLRGRTDIVTRIVSVGVVVLAVLQVTVGVVRVSASYWDDSALGYQAPQWRRTLASPVLDQVPVDCDRLYSNFPEATYLAGFEAQRSPRIRKFASSDRLDELAQAVRAVERGDKSCLIWVSPTVLETPTYQHPFEDLEAAFDLRQVAADDDVAVYVMGPR